MKKNHIPKTLISVVLLMAVTLNSGCETPLEYDRASEVGSHGVLTPAMMTDEVMQNAAVIGDDGELVAAAVYGEGLVLSHPGDNRLAMLVTGNATFSHAQVRELRLNVRQSAAGVISGAGQVTFRSPLSGLEHSTGFIASCIKPVSGWGRTNYGITLVLDEPYAPYGSMQYTHAAVSITPDGHTAGVVLNTRDFCGGTILLNQPENRVSGFIEMLVPGA
jgi:hypothetical protein